MKLVWLYGVPATGKLAIAEELAGNFGYKLFYNSLAVDLGLSIYNDIGEKDFFEFTQFIRQATLLKAIEIGITHYVMTYVTREQSRFYESDQCLSFYNEKGIDIYPVYLTLNKNANISCDILVEEACTTKFLRWNDRGNSFHRVQSLESKHPNAISINNTGLSARQVAKLVVSHVQ